MGRFESELLDWFRTREQTELNTIRDSGEIADVDAFDAKVKEFTDQFEPSEDAAGDEPDPEEQGETTATMVDSETTLPEEDITFEE